MDCFVACAPRKKVGEFHHRIPLLCQGLLTHFHPGGVGALTPVQTRNDGYSKSPPAASAVVPCSRNALMTLRPTFHLCTSSGPSTSRCERTWVYHAASGVSWEKPSAPCS